MNRRKWQGLTCALLASLMMSSAFATSTRYSTPNETPKPVTTPGQSTGTPPTGTPKPVAPTGTPTPVAPVVPNKPEKPTTPAKPCQPAKPVVPVVPNKPEKPATTAKPCQPDKPAMPAVPNKTEKPCQPAKPDKPAKPEKPNKGCASKKTDDKQEAPQKTFTLDHFKMIVCTLKQLGMEDQEIASYIKQGKKLEDILEAKKISPKKFKKCIIKQYNKVIDEGVKEGQLTKEQSKQLKCAIKETVKNWLPNK